MEQMMESLLAKMQTKMDSFVEEMKVSQKEMTSQIGALVSWMHTHQAKT
jgi:hypothetical protein